MRQVFSATRLTSSVIVTLVLLYFMLHTSGSKIIFIPFLICSISMTAKYTALLLHLTHCARLFDKLFVTGFFLFWFGFLAIACYICLRDNQLSLFLFSIPFWLAGFFFAKKRLFK